MSAITINYHNNILQGTLDLLEATELKKLVGPGKKVSIKPNMVLAKPPSLGATTHSEVVEGLILFLKDLGVSQLEIIESSWVGADTKHTYHVCGYDALSKKYNIPLEDLKDDEFCHIKSGEYNMEICKKAVETDFLINVPVLKAHCQTLLTCNLKNLKGCISDKEKRKFHAMGLHGPIAHLNKAIKTHFCLVDGICGDLTFEEGGNPVTRNMLLAGSDPLTIDSYCAGLMGYRVNEIEYLVIASQLGVGELFGPDTKIVELNRDNKPVFTKANSGAVKRLASFISEDSACSACYSSLICALHALNGRYSRKISIGQGFKGKMGAIGCGNCTSRFDKYIKGCPPTAVEIVDFLKANPDVL